jgi:hypothetical protein
VFTARPPLSPVRIQERKRREAELLDRYPGQEVAYVDSWAGDRLTRHVVATSADPMDFQAQLRALDPDVRRQVKLTYVPHPDGLDAPSVHLD